MLLSQSTKLTKGLLNEFPVRSSIFQKHLQFVTNQCVLLAVSLVAIDDLDFSKLSSANFKKSPFGFVHLFTLRDFYTHRTIA